MSDKSSSLWLQKKTDTREVGDRVVKDLSLPIEIKADIQKRELTAYASVFDVLDRQGDIVRRGAFEKTIKEDFNRVKVLYQHDTHRPIGKPVFMGEDSKGLLTVSRIAQVPDGDLALRLAAEGILDRMSIGFEVREAKEFEDEELRSQLSGIAALFPMFNLLDLKLWEYSPVTFAANDEADILAVRSAGGLWVGMSYKGQTVVAPDPGVAVSTEVVGAEVKDDKLVATVEVKVFVAGDMVAWGERSGRVLSVSDDGLSVSLQIYEDGEPTSEVEDVRSAELSEVEVEVAEAASPDQETTDTDADPATPEGADAPDDTHCTACGKALAVLSVDDETKADDLSWASGLVNELRSLARS